MSLYGYLPPSTTKSTARVRKNHHFQQPAATFTAKQPRGEMGEAMEMLACSSNAIQSRRAAKMIAHQSRQGAAVDEKPKEKAERQAAASTYFPSIKKVLGKICTSTFKSNIFSHIFNRNASPSTHPKEEQLNTQPPPPAALSTANPQAESQPAMLSENIQQIPWQNASNNVIINYNQFTYNERQRQEQQQQKQPEQCFNSSQQRTFPQAMAPSQSQMPIQQTQMYPRPENHSSNSRIIDPSTNSMSQSLSQSFGFKFNLNHPTALSSISLIKARVVGMKDTRMSTEGVAFEKAANIVQRMIVFYDSKRFEKKKGRVLTQARAGGRIVEDIYHSTINVKRPIAIHPQTQRPYIFRKSITNLNRKMEERVIRDARYQVDRVMRQEEYAESIPNMFPELSSSTAQSMIAESESVWGARRQGHLVNSDAFKAIEKMHLKGKSAALLAPKQFRDMEKEDSNMAFNMESHRSFLDQRSQKSGYSERPHFSDLESLQEDFSRMCTKMSESPELMHLFVRITSQLSNPIVAATLKQQNQISDTPTQSKVVVSKQDIAEYLDVKHEAEVAFRRQQNESKNKSQRLGTASKTKELRSKKREKRKEQSEQETDASNHAEEKKSSEALQMDFFKNDDKSESARFAHGHSRMTSHATIANKQAIELTFIDSTSLENTAANEPVTKEGRNILAAVDQREVKINNSSKSKISVVDSKESINDTKGDSIKKKNNSTDAKKEGDDSNSTSSTNQIEVQKEIKSSSVMAVNIFAANDLFQPNKQQQLPNLLKAESSDKEKQNLPAQNIFSVTKPQVNANINKENKLTEEGSKNKGKPLLIKKIESGTNISSNLPVEEQAKSIFGNAVNPNNIFSNNGVNMFSKPVTADDKVNGVVAAQNAESVTSASASLTTTAAIATGTITEVKVETVPIKEIKPVSTTVPLQKDTSNEAVVREEFLDVCNPMESSITISPEKKPPQRNEIVIVKPIQVNTIIEQPQQKPTVIAAPAMNPFGITSNPFATGGGGGQSALNPFAQPRTIQTPNAQQPSTAGVVSQQQSMMTNTNTTPAQPLTLASLIQQKAASGMFAPSSSNAPISQVATAQNVFGVANNTSNLFQPPPSSTVNLFNPTTGTAQNLFSTNVQQHQQQPQQVRNSLNVQPNVVQQNPQIWNTNNNQGANIFQQQSQQPLVNVTNPFQQTQTNNFQQQQQPQLQQAQQPQQQQLNPFTPQANPFNNSQLNASFSSNNPNVSFTNASMFVDQPVTQNNNGQYPMQQQQQQQPINQVNNVYNTNNNSNAQWWTNQQGVQQQQQTQQPVNVWNAHLGNQRNSNSGMMAQENSGNSNTNNNHFTALANNSGVNQLYPSAVTIGQPNMFTQPTGLLQQNQGSSALFQRQTNAKPQMNVQGGGGSQTVVNQSNSLFGNQDRGTNQQKVVMAKPEQSRVSKLIGSTASARIS